MNWRRVLCFFGIHAWGKLHRRQVQHIGEHPWESWAHLCHGHVQYCERCHKKSRLRDLCLGPITRIT